MEDRKEMERFLLSLEPLTRNFDKEKLMEEKDNLTDVAVVFVSGKPRSGKDTFLQNLSKLLRRDEEWDGQGMRPLPYMPFELRSSVDKAKTALQLLGWDGEKTDESRKLLSDFKQVSDKYFDGVFKYLLRNGRALECRYRVTERIPALFFQVREGEQIKGFKERLTCPCIHVNFEHPTQLEREYGNMADDQDLREIADISIPFHDMSSEEYRKSLRFVFGVVLKLCDPNVEGWGQVNADS